MPDNNDELVADIVEIITEDLGFIHNCEQLAYRIIEVPRIKEALQLLHVSDLNAERIHRAR